MQSHAGMVVPECFKDDNAKTTKHSMDMLLNSYHL